ncbi:MAG: arylsulfatase [Blastocatellia bacterium]
MKNLRSFGRTIAFLMMLLACLGVASPQRASEQQSKPNVVFILADDLGYGDVGCYGQQIVKTPNIDRLAAEGMRFTQFYAGSTVCAPSRCVLMTGRHTGHAWVRGNAGRANPLAQTLRDEDKTVAEVFKDAGYATAMFGKWGLGEIGSAGHPNRQGFDEFFGYLNQTHAHNYFPSFLIHNSERFPLANVPLKEDPEVGAGYAKEKKQYSHDVIVERALAWLERNHGKPFFLYLPFTLPHANNEANRELGDGQETPDYGDYARRDWKNPDKGQAAMIARLDHDVGRVMAALKARGIDRNTIVLFSSDNGPHREGGNDPDYFKASGPLRGIKRSLTDGGIRVPFIVRWPGKIKAGAVSNHAGYFGDLFALVCELTGQPPPPGLDSISFAPALFGKRQKRHDYLYWEFYEQGSRQAVRMGDWKAIREPMFTGTVRLYDLRRDIGESNDVAAANPELVKRAAALMDQAHVADPKWKVSVVRP